eukprot:jgi/Bigna1/73486/fgenesh1_pg.24_\
MAIVVAVILSVATLQRVGSSSELGRIWRRNNMPSSKDAHHHHLIRLRGYGGEGLKFEPRKQSHANLFISEKEDEISELQLLVSVTPGTVEAVRKLVDPAKEVSTYIPDHAFAIHATPEVWQALQAHEDVLYLKRMKGDWKNDPTFIYELSRRLQIYHEDKTSSSSTFSTNARSGPPQAPMPHLQISLITPRAHQAAAQWSMEYGMTFTPANKYRVRLQIPHITQISTEEILSLVHHLKRDENVHWIELGSIPVARNAAGHESVQAGTTAAQPTKIWDHGITGTDEIIHIHDTGLDTTHCFFDDGAAALTKCTDCTYNYAFWDNTSIAHSYREYYVERMCLPSFWSQTLQSSSTHCPDHASRSACYTSVSTSSLTPLDYFKAFIRWARGGYYYSSLTSSELASFVCSNFTNSVPLTSYPCHLATSPDLTTFDRALRKTMDTFGVSTTAMCPTEFSLTRLSFKINPSACQFSSPQCTTLDNSKRKEERPRCYIITPNVQWLQPKVKAYWAFSDGDAYLNSHGTHVSGSAAGSPENTELSNYKGSAYNASIVFSDGTVGEGGSILTPLDLRTLFRWSYNLGARVSSHSWGSSTNSYSSESLEIDDFAYRNDDFLILFSAGNSGSGGYFSVGQQVNSKNSLSVGAGSQPLAYIRQNSQNVTRQYHRWRIYEQICNSSRLAAKNNELFDVINTAVRGRCGALSVFSSPFAMSSYYCDGSKIDSDAEWNTYACNIYNGVSATNVQCKDRALRALEFVYLGSQDASSVFESGSSEIVSRLKLSHSDFLHDFYDDADAMNKIVIDMDYACGGTANTSLATANQNGYVGEYHMATFSSRGPTLDGRIKPEIVGPGSRKTPSSHGYISLVVVVKGGGGGSVSVISSAADSKSGTEQCTDQTRGSILSGNSPALEVKSGTSMAAPTVAGAVALVRQYYREGWHVSGMLSPSNGIPSPKSALLKATIIASGQQIYRGRESGGNVELQTNTDNSFVSGCSTNSPCTYQRPASLSSGSGLFYHFGYGHVQLASALYFSGDPHKLFQYTSSLSSGSNKCYRINPGSLTSRTTLRAVLVWTDPAASLASSKALVNDLNLKLYSSADQTMKVGNSDHTGSNCPDTINNVEVVAKSLVPNSDEVVSVEAASVNVGRNQSYALVIVAPSTATVQEIVCTSEYVKAPSGCSNDEDNDKDDHTALIVGLVVGIVGLAAIAAVYQIFLHKITIDLV